MEKEKIRKGMSFYKIDNKWFQSYLKETNESTLTVLLLLNVHANRKGHTTVNIKYIMSIFGVSPNSKKSTRSLKESLQFLVGTGQITVYKNFISEEPLDINFNSVHIDETLYVKITPISKNFTILYYNEVKDILSYDKMEFRYRKNLLTFFCAIAMRINNDTNCCYPSIETITKDSGVRSKTTTLKYLEILRDDLGLIIYGSANLSFTTKDGSIFQTPNLYARPEHTKDLKKCINGQYSAYEHKSCKTVIYSDRKITNRKRSLKQLMNHLDKERVFRELTEEEEQYYLALKEEHSSMQSIREKQEKEQKELLTGHLEDAVCDNPYQPYEEEEETLIENIHSNEAIVTSRGTIIDRVTQYCDGW